MFRFITIGALAALLAFETAALGMQVGKRSSNQGQGKAPVFVPGPAPRDNQTISGLPFVPGEVKVVVNGDQNPVVRIGMSQTGETLVEFPEGDNFFAIHPPENGDLVRVEDSPTISDDHHLILRAGPALANASGPAASITVQMRSGMGIVLWIYPVKFLSQQTYRLVFSYNRAEIVAARRASGLAVNLGETPLETTAANTTGSSTTAANTTDSSTTAANTTAANTTDSSTTAANTTGSSTTVANATSNSNSTDTNPSATSRASSEFRPPTQNLTVIPPYNESLKTITAPRDMPVEINKVDLDNVALLDELKVEDAVKEKIRVLMLEESLRKALKDSLGDPKSFKKFSIPTHELSVATKLRDLENGTTIAMVAVKNIGDSPIQLLEDHPQLILQTVNQEGKAIRLESLEKLGQETSTRGNVIPGHVTVYYAVAFKMPFLSNQQKLSVTIGQRELSDDDQQTGFVK